MSSRHLTLRRTPPRATRRAVPAGAPRQAEAARDAVAEVLGAPVQTKLLVRSASEAAEREADAIAERIAGPVPSSPSTTHASAGAAQAAPADTAARIQARRGSGVPLPPTEQAFFEQQLGHPLAGVRMHADREAAHLSANLAAQAFTVGRDVFFAAGEYHPGSAGGRNLIAHELAHVQQQAGKTAVAGGTPAVQRKLELRPPGKGEQSAFGRAQELIDKLNTVSAAIQYKLAGNAITYTVVDASALTHFDKTMQGFIDRGELVPMRLITAKGRVGGGPLFADSFVSAYVDIDDLLADDVHSFQSDLLHFLTERFTVKDYERKIGTNIGGEFPKAHAAGKEAEAAQLRAIFRDPSIVFVGEEDRPNGTWVNMFKSKKLGFWVFQVVKRSDRPVAGGEMWVQRKDGTRASMEDFRKERAAAAP